MSCFEQALLGFFLALDTVASPGDSFQAFGVGFPFRRKRISPKLPSRRRASAPSTIWSNWRSLLLLAEQKFLVVRTGGAIGDVLGGLVIRATAVLLVAGHHVAQFLSAAFPAFF